MTVQQEAECGTAVSGTVVWKDSKLMRCDGPVIGGSPVTC